MTDSTPAEEVAAMTTAEIIQFARDMATVHTALGRDDFSVHGPLYRRLADELEMAQNSQMLATQQLLEARKVLAEMEAQR